jgi:signal transduction histidine kinase
MAGRRPRALVVDSLLAIALAVASLALADTGGEVQEGPVARYDWNLSPPPRDIEPGDVWNAQIVVFRNGVPTAPPGKATPLLTVQNTTTGEWTTTPARPTGTVGVYRARVVFRDPGQYSYSVLQGDESGLVPVGKAAPVSEPAAPEPQPTPGGLVVLLLLATLPIALRRRVPIPVLGLTLAAAIAADLAYDNFPFPGPLAALYTVGAHVGRPGSLVAAGGTAAALPLLYLGDRGLGFWEILGIYAVFAAVWLLGDNLRTRRERAARLEAEREANVRRATAEEQARIARELHDIIGHSVSVMTIQAAAAGDAFDSRPTHVREALRAIESTGRETLAELRRLLAGVRPDESGAFAPAPGLESLDALVERVRAAGLEVELTAEPPQDPLPPSVDLSAYRIVQEALTNTLKHARASRARVDVRGVNGALEIEVADDGQAATAATPGHGIIGMQERAALFGGDLTAGPAPGGGFVVRARLPVVEP